MRNRVAHVVLMASLLVAAIAGLVITPPPAFAAGQPFASLDIPATVMIGAPFSLSVAFDNTDATDTGYGPFVDLVFPSRGADGAGAPDDGVTFLGASYLGAPVTATSLVFPAGGCVTHPYARLQSGAYQQVCGTPGDTLVVLQLPFGSFTPSQPPVQISVDAQLSANADLATPLAIRVRGGFQYGNTPLDDWCCDPVILNPDSAAAASTPSAGWPSAPVTPALVTLSKLYLGPEDETATGPTFPRRYQLQVDVADGQTLANLGVTDLLPPELAFTRLVSATPAGYAVEQTPTVGAPAVAPDNELAVRFPSVTGGAGPDATVVFEAFVPRTDAGSSAVIAPAGGDDVTITNSASASATWDPTDNRDPLTPVDATGVGPGLTHALAAKSLAVQKDVRVVTDTGAAGPTPGDTLEYTLAVQVSDFFAFDGVAVRDIFSDGQRFDAGFTPRLQVTANDFTSPETAFVAANFDVALDSPGSGETTVNFRLSDELVSRGKANGRFVGGCIDLVAGGPSPDCPDNNLSTTATITFRTVIQDTFSDSFPSGDPSVDEGDVLANDVTVTGDVLNTDTFVATGSAEDDDSATSVTIDRGTIAKSIYAVNGTVLASAPTSPLQVAANDLVTYRIQAEFPTSDAEDLRLVDYLPLPIFPVPGVFAFDPAVAGTVPPANTATFGPANSWRAIFDAAAEPDPTVTTDTTANAVSFDFGDFDDPQSRTSTIDLLLTVPVSDRPTADRLFITNQLRRISSSTGQVEAADDAIVQLEVTQPVLRVSKGVVGATNPNAALSTAAGPTSFAAPGTTGAPFAAPINSTNLAATPVDADVSDVDANDLVRFAIVLENQGTGLKGAYDIAITDVLPPGLAIPAGGLNLQVHNGAGDVLAFTSLGGGIAGPADDLFFNGIQLVDTTTGACQAHDLVSGRNVVVVTYDLQVDPNAQPGVPILNRGTLTSYAGTEGGANHVAVGSEPFDSAEVALTPVLTKSLIATSEGTTTGARVTIGEIARFRLVARVPEGRWDNAQLVDDLPAGLRFLDGTARVALISNGGLSSSTIVDPAAILAGSAASTPVYALPGAAISTAAGDVTFSLGDLTNTDNDENGEFAVVEFNALVENVAGNQAGATRTNRFGASRAGTALAITPGTTTLTVVEPAITNVDKVILTPASATGDAGDTVTYRVSFTNDPTANASAFNVRLADTLPAELLLDLNSISVSLAGGATGIVDDSTGNTVDLTFNRLPPGGRVEVEYTVTVAAGVSPGQVIPNSAGVTYTSLPGTNGTVGNPTGSTAPGAPGTDTGERTGSTTPAQNDYLDNDQAPLTILSLAPAKSIVATSEAHTGETADPRPLAVGEVVRYRLASRLAESTATNFQLVDRLPAGLTFLDDGTARVAFVANGGGITSSTISNALPGCAALRVIGNAPPAGGVTCPLPASAIAGAPFASGDAVTFSLGTLANADDDADDEFVVVEFNALADNSAAGGNDAGDTHANDFVVQVNGAQIGAASNSVTTQIAEPSITDLAKVVVTPASASGDAGDTVAFRVTYANAAGADSTDAFDARLADTLPAGFSLNLASVNVTLGGGAAGVTDNSAGNTLDVVVGRVPPGGTVQIDYTANVTTAAAAGATLVNTGDLTYTSLPGANGTGANPTGSSTPGAPGADTGERTGSASPAQNDYLDGDQASFTLTTPAVDKLTPSPVVYTIGELVDYDIRVTLPEGATQGLVVTDFLPDGLAYVSHSIVSTAAAGGANLPADYAGDVSSLAVTRTSPAVAPGSSGEDVVLSFPTVTTAGDNNPNNNAFLVRVRARVLNLAANQAGVTRDNTAAISYDNPTSGTPVDVTDATPETITLAEPVLSIAKSVLTPPSPADAGGVVTYRVVISHAPSSAGTAYDVQVADLLPAGLTNGAVVNVSAVGITPPTGGVAAGQILLPATGSFDLPPGASVTIDYSAEIAPAVTPGQQITNEAVLTWSTLDGASADERSSGDGRLDQGGLNDYEVADDAQIEIDAAAITKSIAATSESATSGSQVAIGEVVTYELAATLPEGITPSLQLVDALPAGLAYVPNSVTVQSAGFNGTAPAPTVTSTGGSGDDVTIDFGQIDVVVDNDASNNILRVQLQARVLDVASNVGLAPGQTVLTNGATLTIGTGAPLTSTPADVTVVEPSLAITKSFSAAGGFAGQTVRVTLVVTNEGTGPAHDVVVDDPLATASFSAASEVTTPAGFTFSTVASGANTIVRYTGGSIAAGASRTFTFDVTLGSALSVGTTVDNTASVTQATTLDGASANERDEPDVNGSDDIEIVAPDLALTKIDGGATATPGGAITFTLLYTNTGSLAATGVVLTETVPANTTFNAAASAPGWSCTPNGNPGSSCTLNVGSLAAGASGSANFVVTVDNPFPIGVTEVVNAARIADDGNNGPEISTTNNNDDEQTPVDAAPDLRLTKTDGGASAVPGGKITFTLLYANTGNQDINGVFLSETVPDYTSFDEADPANLGWSCASGGIAGDSCTFGIGSLAAGASGSVDFVVTVDDPLDSSVRQVVNAARIDNDSPSNPDPTPDNNEDSETTPILFAPDLTIVKSDGGASPLPGQPIAYTLSYRNVGIGQATGVVITETVPQYTNFNAAANAPGWSCTGSLPGSTCTYVVGSVDVGASGQVNFVVTVAARLPAGVTAISNSAAIRDDGAGGADANPADNSSTVTSSFSPTAVRLLRLTAAREGDGVAVRWDTGAEVNTFGFRIVRSATGERADAVEVTDALIPSKGGNSSGASYRFVDTGAEPGVTYSYWLVAVDLDGAREEFGPVTTAPRPARSNVVYLPQVRR